MNVTMIAQYIGNGHSFYDTTRNLEGRCVLVLSRAGMAGTLRDTSHALTDHVLTGAEAYRDGYMSTGSRTPHPSVSVYYVADKRSGRVMCAVQADGTILDEIAQVRPDLRPATRQALTDALVALSARVMANPRG